MCSRALPFRGLTLGDVCFQGTLESAATGLVVNQIDLEPGLNVAGKAPVVPTPEMLQKAGHCGHFSPDPTPDRLVGRLRARTCS